jgi:hypothetical protein
MYFLAQGRQLLTVLCLANCDFHAVFFKTALSWQLYCPDGPAMAVFLRSRMSLHDFWVRLEETEVGDQIKLLKAKTCLKHRNVDFKHLKFSESLE